MSQSHVFPVASTQQMHLNMAFQDTSTSPSVTEYPNTKQTLSDPVIGAAGSPTWFLNEAEEGVDSFHYHNMLDNNHGGSLVADTSHVSPNYDATNIDNNSEFPPLSPRYIKAINATCDSGSTSRDNTPSTFSTEIAFTKTISRVGCDLRLSQLSVDLCQQAQRNMAVDQQRGRTQVGADQELAEVETGPQHLNWYTDTSGQSKQFGDALCSTSEFLAIIQSKLDDIELDDPSTRHEAHWPLMNLSCVLNLISCYLLIVEVFERLVLRLYEQIACNSNETPASDSSIASHSAGPQTLPGFHLASFHVQQSNLQTKILIQIIEHQFEMIEKSLGLPPELHVSSGRREPYKDGLLQSGLDEGLLQAVITRLCPMTGSLASLRENIMKVRRLLAT